MEQPPPGYLTNTPIDWDWSNNNNSTDEEKQQIIEIWKRNENDIPFLLKFDNFFKNYSGEVIELFIK